MVLQSERAARLSIHLASLKVSWITSGQVCFCYSVQNCSRQLIDTQDEIDESGRARGLNLGHDDFIRNFTFRD